MSIIGGKTILVFIGLTQFIPWLLNIVNFNFTKVKFIQF